MQEPDSGTLGFYMHPILFGLRTGPGFPNQVPTLGLQGFSGLGFAHSGLQVYLRFKEKCSAQFRQKVRRTLQGQNGPKAHSECESPHDFSCFSGTIGTKNKKYFSAALRQRKPKKCPNIGALILRIGFWAHYTKIINRNPQQYKGIYVVIQAPILGSKFRHPRTPGAFSTDCGAAPAPAPAGDVGPGSFKV